MEPTAIRGGSPLFSRVLSHKTMFFFYFAFTAESLPSAIGGLDKEPRKRLGCNPSYGTIAQLDRASDSGSEGRWFESV